MQHVIVWNIVAWLFMKVAGVAFVALRRAYETLRDEYYLIGRRLQNRNPSMVL
jgi:hypothetical protein